MIEAFLQAIFGDAPGYIVLWTADNKKSRCFQNNPAGLADLAKFAVRRAEEADVYFELSLHPSHLPASARGKAEHATSIGCMWADVDYGPGHKKAVAPDEATAPDRRKRRA